MTPPSKDIDFLQNIRGKLCSNKTFQKFKKPLFSDL